MMRARRRRSRASVMTEFALLLPFMLYMMAFTLDMGRIIYAAHSTQSAVTDAARQSAVFGAAGVDGSSTDAMVTSRSAAIAECNASTTSCRMGLYAMQQALANTPGGATLKSWDLSVAEDPTLKLGRTCTSTTPALKLTLDYQIDWLTPGMNVLLGVGEQTLSALNFSTSVTARCEVELP
jgi:Flp pilus assembly protein TadG